MGSFLLHNELRGCGKKRKNRPRSVDWVVVDGPEPESATNE